MPDLDSDPETSLLHSFAAPIQFYLTLCWASPHCHQFIPTIKSGVCILCLGFEIQCCLKILSYTSLLAFSFLASRKRKTHLVWGHPPPL